MKTAGMYLALVIIMLCAGCGNDLETPVQPKINLRQSIYLFVDPETGCQYISSYVTAAITPRMDAQGKHICGKTQGDGHDEETHL